MSQTEKLKVDCFPCFEDDVKAIEAWLEDMAAEGYRIDKFVTGGIRFQKQKPARVRYRLLLSPDYALNKRIITEHEQQVIDLHAKSGWECVAKRGNYLYFLAEDYTAPELDQDFHVILNAAKQKQKKWYVSDLLLCIFLLIVLVRNISVMSFIDLVTPLGVLLLILLRAYHAKELAKLQSKIVAGVYETETVNWKSNAKKYKMITGAGILAIVLLWAGVLGLLFVRIIQ